MRLFHLGLVHHHSPDCNRIRVAIDLDTPWPSPDIEHHVRERAHTTLRRHMMRRGQARAPSGPSSLFRSQRRRLQAPSLCSTISPPPPKLPTNKFSTQLTSSKRRGWPCARPRAWRKDAWKHQVCTVEHELRPGELQEETLVLYTPTTRLGSLITAYPVHCAPPRARRATQADG